MAWFKPHNLLDRIFEVGIILKGLDGLIEVIGGLTLLFVTPDTINVLVASWTRGELSQDPHDFVATHLLKTAHGLTGSGLLFGALYLLSHGLVKIVLVVAVLKNKLWAYPWLIAFLVAFIFYQLYRMWYTPSLALAALTVFDVFIAWLTYLEWRKHQAAAERAEG
jgi:uncharacterized membrane protein